MKRILLASILALLMAERGVAQTAVGDCNGDLLVTIDEIVVGVNIALGQADLAACPAFDADGDDEVAIDEIIIAVNALLNTPSVTPLAFVTATDFETGGFATVTLAEPRTVAPAGPERRLGSDPIARVFGQRVFVVNRFGSDNLQVLDAAQQFATLGQCSTGPGSNPNDIAFLNGRKAYIPLYARSSLLIVDPSRIANCDLFEIGSIDLSAYADDDGIPEMSQVGIHNGRVYVSLQRLESFVPADNGAIVVIDAASDTVIDVIELSGQNPFGMTNGLTIVGNSLYVTEVGSFGVNDGGIERVDLETNEAKGFVVTEAALGGDITDFVLVSEELGYAILSLPDFSTALVSFNPGSGTLIRAITGGNGLTDIEVNSRGEFYLSDRNFANPGLRIFQASDGTELTSSPLSTGLPPFGIVFLE